MPLDSRNMGRILQVELTNTSRVLLFAQWLVEHAIRRVSESDTAEAVGTATTVVAMDTIATCMRQNAERTTVGVIAICAPETLLALEAVAALRAVLAFVQPITIEKRLAKVRAVTEVTVPGIKGKITIVAVLDILVIESRTWHDMLELSKLLEEWTREIEGTTVQERVPVIPPPR